MRALTIQLLCVALFTPYAYTQEKPGQTPTSPTNTATPTTAGANTGTPTKSDAPKTAASPDGQRGLVPLPEAERKAYAQIEADPRPKSLTRNSHYVVSDEKEHFLLRQAVSGLGGAYIGVGTNQNYEFVAWAKSDIVFMLDFDQLIVDLHGVYEVAFLGAKTPDQFIQFWSKRNEKSARSTLRERFSEPKKLKQVLKAFKLARRATYGKLRRVKRRHARKNITSYLNDQTQYDYIVNLFRTGRVFPVRGDLTATTTMRRIAEELTRFKRHLGVIYVSNCEQYFAKLPATYKANMLRFPVKKSSLVLRTRPWLERRKPGQSDKNLPVSCSGCKTRGKLNYTYMFQDFDNLRAWFTNPKTRLIHHMVQKRATRVKGKALKLMALPTAP